MWRSGNGSSGKQALSHSSTGRRTIMQERMATQQRYDGLRSFLTECEKLGEVKVVKNADWNLEIGALTETVSELINEPPALMFDEIKDYPKGFRVLSIPTASRVRMCLAL